MQTTEGKIAIAIAAVLGLLTVRGLILCAPIKPVPFTISLGESQFLNVLEALDEKRFAGSTDCGEVCTYKEGTGETHGIDLAGKKIDVVQKNIECPAMFRRLLHDYRTVHDVQWPPPHWSELPESLKRDYLMDGKVELLPEWYLQARYAGEEQFASGVWKKGDMEYWSSQLDTASFPHSYEPETTADLASAIKRHSEKTEGKVGVVLGSERPWVELILKSQHYGKAKKVWTLEYGKLYSEHPDFVTTLPSEFAQMMLLTQDHGAMFDFAATFSSLEHSGLGRYGDVLDPFADLEAVAQTWCAIKTGGYFFFGVPTPAFNRGAPFVDQFYYNAHRMYGPNRLAQIFSNFKLVDAIPMSKMYEYNGYAGKKVLAHHTVFVLMKLPQRT